ncbi:hypothetical protein [Methanosarcina sp. Kolksee]
MLRGGSWDLFAKVCRSAIRAGNKADFRYNNIGFRLLRKL